MRFSDLTWMDVEDYLENDDRVILTFGACEQHAYLSLMTDINTPLAIAEEAIREEPVLIAPPLNFGSSPYYMDYPGTISLSPELFLGIARELFENLYWHGFRGFLFNNGHGGNAGMLRTLAVELNNDFPDARIRYFEWWKHPLVREFAAEHGLKPDHANWSEAFEFNIVDELPEEPKPFPDLPMIASAEMMRFHLGDGNYGGAYKPPEGLMEKILKSMAGVLVEELRALNEG